MYYADDKYDVSRAIVWCLVTCQADVMSAWLKWLG